MAENFLRDIRDLLEKLIDRTVDNGQLLERIVEIVGQEGRQIDKVSNAYTELLSAMEAPDPVD